MYFDMNSTFSLLVYIQNHPLEEEPLKLEDILGYLKDYSIPGGVFEDRDIFILGDTGSRAVVLCECYVPSSCSQLMVALFF